jgi:hypothetical protein
MSKPQTKKEEMRAIFDQNGLTKEDIFAHKHFVIITRSGIEKIMAVNDIKVTYEEIKMERDFVVIKARATKGKDHWVETYGEAGPENCRNAYYVATAEKRAMSRSVLKLVGLYMHSVLGEDEEVVES